MEIDNLEAERLQYQLRASFFLRKLKEFLDLKKEIEKPLKVNPSWDRPRQIGISESAWEKVKAEKIKPHLIFCHPDLITFKPDLIAYYRLLSVFPQKGVQRLAFGIQELEERSRKELGKDRALQLAILFNETLSSLLDQNPGLSVEDLQLLAAMNFDTQVNGSWRNEIGKEGSRKVKELLLNFFLKLKAVKEIELASGDKVKATEAKGISIDEARAITLTNKHRFVFASEPDISVMNEADELESAIEIKAGLDPAGALERYGAAKKSFDKALALNKSAITVYLASCITEEVKNRIKDDRLVRKEFDLARILTDKKSREKFLEYVKWLAHI